MANRFVWLLCAMAGCAHASAPNSSSAPAGESPPTEPAAKEADSSGSHGHTHGYDKDFSSARAYAARFDAPERDEWQKPAYVVELLDVRAGHTVADIGAGTGYFLGPLHAAVGSDGRVLALDVEPNMVDYMRQRARSEGYNRVEVRQVEADDPGLDPQSVDRILIVNTWHHISDRVGYAQKLQRALREGGRLMIVDFTRESDQGPPPEHRLAPDQVVEELSAAGLSTEVVDETLPKQYVVVGRK